MILTPAEKRLQRLLQVWMVVFLVAGSVFVLLGNLLLGLMNEFSAVLFPSSPLLNPEQTPFWLALVGSLMGTLVFLCYWAQKDLKRNLFAVVPLLISKFLSSLFFLLFFFFVERSFSYLAGTVVDGSIFVITYVLYLPVRNKRLT